MDLEKLVYQTELVTCLRTSESITNMLGLGVCRVPHMVLLLIKITEEEEEKAEYKSQSRLRFSLCSYCYSQLSKYYTLLLFSCHFGIISNSKCIDIIT